MILINDLCLIVSKYKDVSLLLSPGPTGDTAADLLLKLHKDPGCFASDSHSLYYEVKADTYSSPWAASTLSIEAPCNPGGRNSKTNETNTEHVYEMANKRSQCRFLFIKN